MTIAIPKSMLIVSSMQTDVEDDSDEGDGDVAVV